MSAIAIAVPVSGHSAFLPISAVPLLHRCECLANMKSSSHDDQYRRMSVRSGAVPG